MTKEEVLVSGGRRNFERIRTLINTLNTQSFNLLCFISLYIYFTFNLVKNTTLKFPEVANHKKM